jgi:3-phosphoshikimate 1-carboxyvinyltransferase
MSEESESLSPWGMTPVPAIRVLPLNGRRIDACLAIPGSKSFTNRAIILAAAAKGKTILRNPLFSDDSYWCAEAVGILGRKVDSDRKAGIIAIEGGTFKVPTDSRVPFIGSAGTTARFLPGILAARGEGKITLTASAQLSGRPLKEVVEALKKLGADISFGAEGKSFPLHIGGGTLKGGAVSISGAKSSQFLSGLLMAAPLAQKETIVTITDHVVQADYVRITLQLMKDFGVTVDVDRDFKRFAVPPQEYRPQDLSLEADASTATYFFALAAGSGGKVTVTNLNVETVQPDFAFVRSLEAMGCKVDLSQGRVTVEGPKVLRGTQEFDFRPLSDSTPSLIAIAPFADGTVEVRGVEHIRAHECDRIAVMRETLEKAKVPVEEFPDGLKVTPAPPFADITVDPHDDHRMAMAFSVMGALGRGAIIRNPACVSKTCPDFFELIRGIGVEWEKTA